MSLLHWTCGLAIGASMFALGVAPARERVVALAPQSAALFAAMGLPVNLDRLEIGAVHATVRTEEGRRILLVESEIGNPREASLPLPVLRVSVRDGSGAALYSWTPAQAARTIGGRSRVPFRARLTSPPDGHDVVVEFVRPTV